MTGWLIAGALVAWFAIATGTGLAVGALIHAGNTALHTDLNELQ